MLFRYSADVGGRKIRSRGCRISGARQVALGDAMVLMVPVASLGTVQQGGHTLDVQDAAISHSTFICE